MYFSVMKYLITILALMLIIACENEEEFTRQNKVAAVTYLNFTSDTISRDFYCREDYPPYFMFDTVTGDMRRLFVVYDSSYAVLIAKNVESFRQIR